MPLIYHEGYSLGDGAGNNQLLKDTVGWIGKNLLKNTAESGSYQGITYTVNSDKSITINGTNTDSAQHAVIVGIVTLDAGTYKVNGLKNNGGYTSFWINLYNLTDSSNIIDVKNANEDLTFILSAPKQVRVLVYWAGNATVSNITIYPMIRKADIIDPTYEPYHESVETMYEEEIHGVNLADSSTADIGIAWNGNTNSDRARLAIPCSPNTEYIASINGTNAMSYIGYVTSPTIIPSQTALIDFASPASITTGANDRYIIIGFAKTGITQANVDALKFMLRKADIEDSTYRPYNPQAIQNQLNAQGVLGAKNLLPNNATSQTVNGVTFTKNADGSVTANGTATAPAELVVCYDLPSLYGGRYILSGCPFGGAINKYRITAYRVDSIDGQSGSLFDIGNGLEFTYKNTTGNAKFIIYIENGVTVSNLTFKPMLRLASDPDDTYQPYAMTNRELTEKKINIADLKTVVSASSDFTDFKTRIASL